MKAREVPGPGQYESKDYSDGSYFLSSYKNPGVRKFGTEQRLSARHLKIDTPGPGTYRPPSDFGYVELLKYSPRT